MSEHWSGRDYVEVGVALLAMLIIAAALFIHFVPSPETWWQLNP